MPQIVRIDTDGTLAGNSDAAVASQKATKTYVDAHGATGANPTASVGLTAVNGTAGTFLRSDGSPALANPLKPAIDSTTAIQITKADGTTAVLTIDTLNNKVIAGGKIQSGYAASDPWGASPALGVLEQFGTTDNLKTSLAVIGKNSTHKAALIVSAKDTAVYLQSTWAAAVGVDLILGGISSGGTYQESLKLGGADGTVTLATNGAASAPPLSLTGTWFSGGTGTTTKPAVLIEPAGTASTNWNTSGTGIGVNAPVGFTGNLLDVQVAGVNKAKIDSAGKVWCPGVGSATGVTTILAEGGTAFNIDYAGGVYTTLYGFQAGVLTLQGQVQVKSGFATISGAGQFGVQAASAGTVGATVQGAASRTAPLVQLQTDAGASLGNVGSCRFDHVADAASVNTNGTFDTLYTDTLPANALAINGDKIEFDYTLKIIHHVTATAQVQVLFGGITIFDSGAVNYAADETVRIVGQIHRATATTCRATVNWIPSGLNPTVTYTGEATLTGLTLTATNILLLKAAAAAANAAASDITALQGSIDIIPAGS